MKDETALKKALALVREREPNAVRLLLETSDQDFYGFVLNDVVLSGPDKTLLSQVSEARWDELSDELWEHLCNLRWDGVVGEDKGGRADLPLYAAPAKPFRILRTTRTGDFKVHTYRTIEERDAAAVRFAKRDGHDVTTELWALEHPQDDLNRGWGCDGVVRAPQAVTAG